MLNCPLPLGGNNQMSRAHSATDSKYPPGEPGTLELESRPRIDTYMVTCSRFTKQNQFLPDFKQRLGEAAEALRHGQERGRRVGIELRVVLHERVFLDHFREFPASLLRFALTRPKPGI